MDSLVSTDWLHDRLGSPELAILDASSHLPMSERDARAEFTEAHIPGARFLDLATLVDPDSPVPAALPRADQLASRLADLGVGSGDRIVICDDSAVKTSARAWFMMRMYGMDEVTILDGGVGKWRAENRPLERGAPAGQTPANARPLELSSGPGPVRSKAAMLANLESGTEQVVDARDTQRFTGELPDFRPNIARGHIPGSRNLPFGAVLNEDGTYQDPATLRATFAEAGIDLAKPVVTTCGGGVTAAVLLFALHLAGKKDVALYDGSWGEWGADLTTPKATGEAPDG